MSLITKNTIDILTLKDDYDDIFMNYMTHLYKSNKLDLLNTFHLTTNTFYNN